jgi:hypothetical protein
MIISIVNTGRLDKALAERGLTIEPEDGDLARRGYPYTVDLVWPTGETSGFAYVSDLGGDIVAIPLPDGPATHTPRRVVLSMDESITGLCALR